MECKWLRKPKDDTAIIFIHGFNSSDECWINNRNGSYWPTLLQEEKEFSYIGVYIFSYQTGALSGSYNLGDIVDSLKEYISIDKVINCEKIIFICHSMGGIIARRYIVSQQSLLFAESARKIGLFLVASPSLGSDYANMIKILSNMLGNAQSEALRFSQTNTWLNDLDKDFLNLKEQKKELILGKELIEDKSMFSRFFFLRTFTRKQIVEPFSAAKYFGNPFKVPGSDHLTISKPASRDSIQHRILCKFINDFIGSEVSSDSQVNSNQLGHAFKKVHNPKNRDYTKNPFQYAGALTAKSEVYIPRECDQRLSEFLKKYRLVVIQGGFQYGKTSLLSRTQDMMSLDGKHWDFCYVDLLPMRTENPEVFMSALFRKLSRFLKDQVNDWSELSDVLSSKSVIFGLDEFGKLSDDIVNLLIPGLYWLTRQQNLNIRIIICLPVKIEDFLDGKIKNPKYYNWKTISIPALSISEFSYLFNFFPKEVSEVVYKYREEIFSKSSGNPAKVQYLCHCLFEACNESSFSFESNNIQEVISSPKSYDPYYGL